MGTVVSKAANGLGAVLGNAFVAPIKTIFGNSCEGVCSGTWDIICFVEHLCIPSLLKLLMVSILTYISLLFFYLLFKVGIIQCVGRSLCKMTWAACETYWTALIEISSFLWYKLKNTKRVHRRRFVDMEKGFSTSDDYDLDDYGSVRVARRRRSVRERRKDRIRRSLYPTGHSSKRMHRSRSGSRHHVRLKTREVSVHVKGSGRIRNSRRNTAHQRGQNLFKRQRAWKSSSNR